MGAELLFDAKPCDFRDGLRARIFWSIFSVARKEFCPRVSLRAATTSTAALQLEAQGWRRGKMVES